MGLDNLCGRFPIPTQVSRGIEACRASLYAGRQAEAYVPGAVGPGYVRILDEAAESVKHMTYRDITLQNMSGAQH